MINNIRFGGMYTIKLDEVKGWPVARMYKTLQSGKNKGELKYSEGYRFRTSEEREQWVRKQIDLAKEIEEKESKRAEEKKARKESFKESVKVGDIFVCSWGYEQTNVDCYQVTSKKGSQVELREINQEMVPDSAGHDSCHVIPVPNSFQENKLPFTKMLGDECIKMNSYSSAFLWDGKRSYYNSWYY